MNRFRNRIVLAMLTALLTFSFSACYWNNTSLHDANALRHQAHDAVKISEAKIKHDHAKHKTIDAVLYSVKNVYVFRVDQAPSGSIWIVVEITDEGHGGKTSTPGMFCTLGDMLASYLE